MVYRVWYHPSRGSDYARSFKSKQAAASAARKSKIAEKVIYKAKGRSLVGSEQAIELSSIKKRKSSGTSFYGGIKFKVPSYRL